MNRETIITTKIRPNEDIKKVRSLNKRRKSCVIDDEYIKIIDKIERNQNEIKATYEPIVNNTF